MISLDHTIVPSVHDDPALRLEIWTLANRAYIPELLHFAVYVLRGPVIADKGGEGREDEEEEREVGGEGGEDDEDGDEAGEDRLPSRTRQVWLRGWSDSPSEAAWIMEECIRKQNRSFAQGGSSSVPTALKWMFEVGDEGWSTRAWRAREGEGRVEQFDVQRVVVG